MDKIVNRYVAEVKTMRGVPSKIVEVVETESGKLYTVRGGSGIHTEISNSDIVS